MTKKSRSFLCWMHYSAVGQGPVRAVEFSGSNDYDDYDVCSDRPSNDKIGFSVLRTYLDYLDWLPLQAFCKFISPGFIFLSYTKVKRACRDVEDKCGTVVRFRAHKG